MLQSIFEAHVSTYACIFSWGRNPSKILKNTPIRQWKLGVDLREGKKRGALSVGSFIPILIWPSRMMDESLVTHLIQISTENYKNWLKGGPTE